MDNLLEIIQKEQLRAANAFFSHELSKDLFHKQEYPDDKLEIILMDCIVQCDALGIALEVLSEDGNEDISFSLFEGDVKITNYNYYRSLIFAKGLAAKIIEKQKVLEFNDLLVDKYYKDIQKPFDANRKIIGFKKAKGLEQKRIEQISTPEKVDEYLDFIYGGTSEEGRYAYEYLTSAFSPIDTGKPMDINDFGDEKLHRSFDYMFEKETGYIWHENDKCKEYEEQQRQLLVDYIKCSDLCQFFVSEEFDNQNPDMKFLQELEDLLSTADVTAGCHAFRWCDFDEENKLELADTAVHDTIVAYVLHKFANDEKNRIVLRRYPISEEDIKDVICKIWLTYRTYVSSYMIRPMVLHDFIPRATEEDVPADGDKESKQFQITISQLESKLEAVENASQMKDAENASLKARIIKNDAKAEYESNKPLRAEISALKAKIESLENDKKELADRLKAQETLVEYLDSDNETESVVVDFDRIMNTHFLLVGGRDKITNAVLDKTSFRKVIKEAYGGSLDLSAVDYVVFFTDYMDHALYYKIINAARAKDKKVIYCKGSNVDNIFKQIQSQL